MNDQGINIIMEIKNIMNDLANRIDRLEGIADEYSKWVKENDILFEEIILGIGERLKKLEEHAVFEIDLTKGSN